jgi:hypothetical protein
LRAILGLVVVAIALLDPPSDLKMAYVDPGLGAMMLQLATAGVFGALFYLRELRRSFARLVARIRGRIGE